MKNEKKKKKILFINLKNVKRMKYFDNKKYFDGYDGSEWWLLAGGKYEIEKL